MQDKITLFVCSGNTCRSQMAAALASHLYQRQIFISAGTHAIPSEPTSTHALTLLRERGIDWSGVSQKLSSELLSQSDLVLVMTHKQRHLVEQMLAATNISHAVVKLLVSGQDIADPYGQDICCYRNCLRAIEMALKYGFNW